MHGPGVLATYGDMRERIKGVACTGRQGRYFTGTRLHEWKVQRSGRAEVDALQEAWRGHLKFRRNNSEFIAAYERFEFERSSEAASTWTRVNNCTGKPDDDDSGGNSSGYTNGERAPQRIKNNESKRFAASGRFQGTSGSRCE